jgi:hypothetical protein
MNLRGRVKFPTGGDDCPDGNPARDSIRFFFLLDLITCLETKADGIVRMEEGKNWVCL